MILDFVFQYWQNLLLVLSVYAVGVASPGPSTLMILNAAIIQGRRQAIALSMGVVAGSLIWAMIVATGLDAAMKTSNSFFVVMKFAGGFYLLYLSAKSFRSATLPQSAADPGRALPEAMTQLCLKGFLIQLTNPKAPLVWLVAFSMGSEAEVDPLFLTIVPGCCILIATAIYTGYAILFSTYAVMRAYVTMRRPFELLISALFGFSAIAMLMSRS